MLTKDELEKVEWLSETAETDAEQFMVDMVNRLNAECERLRCCGNCRCFVYSQSEAVYWCENPASINHGIPTDTWESCEPWEERDAD